VRAKWTLHIALLLCVTHGGAGCGMLSSCGETPIAGDEIDSGVTDAVEFDAGVTDGARPDSLAPDATTPDAAASDTAAADSTRPDSLALDVATPDAVAPDAETPDAAAPDTAVADAGGDDATTPDAGTLPSCGTIRVLRDDFSDPEQSWQWWDWAESNVLVREESGAFAIDLPNQSNSSGGYTSAMRAPLRDSAVSVEVIEVPEPTSDGLAIMEYGLGGDDDLALVALQGYLSANWSVGGEWMNYEVPYDETSQRWWRIREDGGRVYFETAPDGSSWSTLTDIPTPTWVDHGRLSIWGDVWGSGVAPGSVIFDNVNIREPAEGFCPVATLSDDFEDASLGAIWNPPEEGGCSWTEGGGHLDLIAEEWAVDSCRIRSSYNYSLEESEIVLQISTLPTPPSDFFAGIYLASDADNFFMSFGLHDSQVAASEDFTGFTLWVPALSYTWLRLQKIAGVIYLDASEDGVDWTPLDSFAHPYVVFAASVVLQARPYPSAQATVTASFHAVNP